jgi:outer membrane murein-binding lipoprotein Lpp
LLVSITLMLRFIAVFVGIAGLIGCSGAPVQEMSDARQAIAAARVAGATEASSPDFYAAQAAIARAEQQLQAEQYTQARLAAMEAKRHAAAALSSAQHGDATGTAAPVAAPGAITPDVSKPAPPQ